MDERLKILFEKYQEGTATAEERRLLESWFDSFPLEKEKLNPAEEAGVFADLDARISAMLGESGKTAKTKFRWLQVAAVFIALIGTITLIKRTAGTKPVQPETYTEIKSRNGEKKEVTLKDGTTVFLNSGSSIFISSKFDQHNREVKLTGEAFFHVHRNVNKPFIIHSGKLQTTVLGTSFDIKAYPEDDRLKVIVSTGKVKVEATAAADGKPMLVAGGLTHNQSLVYDKMKDTHSVRPANADSVSAWRTNHMNFEQASYEEIARTIARWYNLEVTLDHSTQDSKRYTLSFNNEPADKVLNVLSDLTGMTYKMKGNKVTIHPKNTN